MLKINEVAGRTGFSPATLRYYETLGLLPAPTRTASGYRSYDATVLDRLAFIARAKQLGCSLEEIAGLLTAWEGGRCGPLQDRLRHLVAGKTNEARAQVVRLTTLIDDLQRCAMLLERHRPDGACDDACGCISDPSDDPAIASSSAIAPEATSRTTSQATPDDASEVDHEPIACSLGPASLHGQIEHWQTLLAHATGRAALDGGVRVDFGNQVPTAELMQLVAAEQSCCQFLRFAITVDTRGIGLEVRGRHEARTIIETLFGAADAA